MGAPLEFRPLGADDITTAHAIHCAAAEQPWSLALWQAVLAPNYRNFVLSQADEPVAVAVFSKVLDEVELQMIVVHPAWQRQGYGRQLLAAALNRLRSQQLKRILLEVDVDNSPALGLYSELGFSRVGLRKAYYKQASGSGDAVVMEKLFNA